MRVVANDDISTGFRQHGGERALPCGWRRLILIPPVYGYDQRIGPIFCVPYGIYGGRLVDWPGNIIKGNKRQPAVSDVDKFHIRGRFNRPDSKCPKRE